MNPRPTASTLILQMLSTVFLAGLVTLAGFRLAPQAGLGTAGVIALGAGCVLALAATFVFRRASPWGQIVFLAGAFLFGILLPSLLGIYQITGIGRGPAVLAIVGLALSAGLGRLMRRGFMTLARLLLGLSTTYWIGWFALGLAGAGSEVEVLWSGIGYVLFFGMTASWSAGLARMQSDWQPVQKAAELYLLALNLLLAARGMLSPF